MPDNRRVKEETIIGMTCVTISKAQRSDAGNYSMHLENEFGSANFKIEVVVLDKPSAPENFKVSKVYI